MLSFLGYPKPLASQTSALRSKFPQLATKANLGSFLVRNVGGAAALFDTSLYDSFVAEAIKASSFDTIRQVETALSPANQGNKTGIDPKLLQQYKSTRSHRFF